jgi:hypothetical protein
MAASKNCSFEELQHGSFKAWQHCGKTASANQVPTSPSSDRAEHPHAVDTRQLTVPSASA